jgi:hypothetical protein
MKHLKILGLAAVAALALMAAIGASTASANALLCSTTGDSGTIININCSNTTKGTAQIPNPTTIKASLKPGTVAELTSTFDNVKCTTSEVSGTASGETGTGNIESMTFSGCTDSFGGACTADTSASSTNKWPATVTTTTVGVHDGNGLLHVSNITGKFSCPIGTCRYTASTATPHVTGGEPAHITATKIVLNREEVSTFGCSATATWSATYVVTTPKSLWVI